MRKLFTVLLCIILMVFSGCTSAKKEEPAPKSVQPDTTHVTAEDKGVIISTSREVRDMTQMIKPTKEGNTVFGILVALENNSRADVPISPDFVTLKTTDGTTHKYSPELTNSKILGKSAFSNRTIPPDYRGGGLLIFEVTKGVKAESLTYKDNSGHNMSLNFQTQAPKNNV